MVGLISYPPQLFLFTFLSDFNYSLLVLLLSVSFLFVPQILQYYPCDNSEIFLVTQLFSHFKQS